MWASQLSFDRATNPRCEEQTGQLLHAVGVQPDLAQSTVACGSLEKLSFVSKKRFSRLKSDSSLVRVGEAVLISAVWAHWDAGIRRPGARGFGHGLVT